MPPTSVPDLLPVLPELVLAITGGVLLMVGVFRGAGADRSVGWLSVLAFAVVGLLVVLAPGGEGVAFEGLFVVDSFAAYMKILVLIGAASAVVMSFAYNARQDMARFEYPLMMLFATLGMLLMISANDLIALYMGVELQSLSLYVLAAFRRDNTRSSESGLKYFVLGALSSGMLLYGASLVYGFTGATQFAAIADALDHGGGIGAVVGIVFLIAGLAFKVSAVPFHMWTPDVYEGAPTPVTAFFSVAPKIAAIALILRVMIEPFGAMIDEWRQVIVFISIASMILGALAAVAQTNIKRLMAYSSIGHVGYALVGLAAGTEAGVQGVIVYMTIYLFMTLGTFACILCMRIKGEMMEGVADLAGLAKTHPTMALAMAIFMFSMAGIPPLAGFFGKLYVFLAAVEAGLYGLAIVGLLTSVIGAFYYLRIVKVMYFDEPVDALDRPIGREMGAILAGTGIVTLFFFLWPSGIVAGAGTAAAALFAG